MAGRLEWDDDGLRGIFDGEVKRDLERRLRNITNRAQALVPKKTGALHDSIKWSIGGTPGGIFNRLPSGRFGPGDWSGTVGTDVEYAIYQHEGTGVYGPAGVRITPRAGKALRFIGAGDAVYIRNSVAGNPPVPFLENALSAGAD